jgi:putative DNA primase/helicase
MNLQHATQHSASASSLPAMAPAEPAKGGGTQPRFGNGQAKAPSLNAEQLVQRAKDDPAAPFEPSCLDFLARLKKENPAEFERTRRRLKSAGSRVGELDELLVQKPADDGGSDEVRMNQAQLVLSVVGPEAELFHTPDGAAYMLVLANGHKAVAPVESEEGAKLIQKLFYERTKQIAQRESIKAAQSILAYKAAESDERKVYVRVASKGGCIFLDLCNDHHQAIRISPNGWDVVSIDAIPVIFTRKPGMRPLPMPASGGKIADLKPFLNLAGENEFRLYVAALTYAFNSRGPYPLVALFGEHGAAKSTQAIIFRMLIDPSISMLRSMPRTEDDLFVQALSCWLQVYDNVSRISGDTSDALCRLLTGGGIGKRQLYTDTGQVLIDIMRPAIVTSIPDVAERPDLADRSIMLACKPIPPSERKAESELWEDFDQSRPLILGAVLDMVACGLRELPNVNSRGLYRMADFHQWGRAIEGMNGGVGSFDAAYRENRDNAVVVAIETDLLAYAILRLVKGLAPAVTGERQWTGTATELRNVLIAQAGEAARLGQQPGFPKNARALSHHLTRISPLLRAIDINWKPNRTAEERGIVLSAPEGGKFGSLGSMASSVPPVNDASDAHDANSSTLGGGGDPDHDPDGGWQAER